MFASNHLHSFQVEPGKSSNCTSIRKENIPAIDHFSEIKSDGVDLSNHNNRCIKGRKILHSPTMNDDEEYEPSAPKLRVATNLMERELSNTPNGYKAASTTSSENTSPDVKSISNNDENQSNEPSIEQEPEKIAERIYNTASNEYFAQALLLTKQEVQQTILLAKQEAQQIFDQHQSQHFEHQNSQGQYPAVYLPTEENPNSRQRKERMSKRQKELYVEFLEQNPVVNKHRRNDPLLDIFWLRLANILNSCPNGAAKSVAEWKQAFDNWRYRVYLYARHNSQLNGEDAINSKAFKPLTRTDKRAYNLWIRNPDTSPANTEKLPNDLTCSED